MDSTKLVWSCANCTFENDQSSFVCGVCDMFRPARAALTQPQEIAPAPLAANAPVALPEAAVRVVMPPSVPTAVVEDPYCSDPSCFHKNPCPVHGAQVTPEVDPRAKERACREKQARKVAQEAEKARQTKAAEDKLRLEREQAVRLEKQAIYEQRKREEERSRAMAQPVSSSPCRVASSSSSHSVSPSPSTSSSTSFPSSSTSTSPHSLPVNSPIKPPSADDPPKPEPLWKCKICTLDNPLTRFYCEVCDQMCTDPVMLEQIKTRIMGQGPKEDICGCNRCVARRARGVTRDPLAVLVQGIRAAATVDRLSELLRESQGGDMNPLPSAALNPNWRQTQSSPPPKPKEDADAAWRKSLAADQYIDARHSNGHYYVAYIVAVEKDNLSLRFVEIDGELTVSRFSPLIAPAQTKSDTMNDEGDEFIPAEPDFAESTSIPPELAGMSILQFPDGRRALMANAFMDMLSMTGGREEPPELPDVNPESLSKEERTWREGLKVGDLLDSLDTANQWYIAEIIDEEKGGERFKISFTEWQAKWDTWLTRWSARIAEPKTKSKTRAEQDPDTISLRSVLPDYSHINMAHTPGCVTNKPVPSHVSKGRMILSKMPGDNSCLFHAIGFVCGGQISPFVGGDEMMRNRLRCAEAIAKDPVKYCPVVLGGCSTMRYSDKLKMMQEWGGAIELQILADFFQVEIISFDVVGSLAHGPMVYKFPASAHSYTKRVFLVYRNNHYDALVFLHRANRTPQLQEFFAITDLHAIKLARRHVEMIHLALHRKGYGAMKWRGLNAEEMAPVLNRSASQTLGDDQEDVPTARLKRAQSEKGNY